MLLERAAWERSAAAWEKREGLRASASALWGPLRRAADRAGARAADLQGRMERAAAFVCGAAAKIAAANDAQRELAEAEEHVRWSAARGAALHAAATAAATASKVLSDTEERAAAAAARAKAAEALRGELLNRLETARGLHCFREAAALRITWEAERAEDELRRLDAAVADAQRGRDAADARAAAKRARQAAAAPQYLAVAKRLAIARADEQAAAETLAVARDGGRRAAEAERKLSAVGAYGDRTQRRLTLLQLLLARLAGGRKKNAEGKEAARADGDEEGYENWVFRTVALPLVVRETNLLIAACGETVRAGFALTAGGFSATVQDCDDGDVLPLSMGSGYQKQLVFCGMRLTLLRLGSIAGGCRVRHMILDEGFVGSDSDNLPRTGDVLRYMMAAGNLKSVLLISHLDAVRECADEWVEVVRPRAKGGAAGAPWRRGPSVLEYGAPLPPDTPL
jgi:DNA repair exonuclease SbcCD ATPase subunit